MARKSARQATPNQIRIIGGDWRGRKLSFPSIDGLRPTGDRIRETLFNWLAPDIYGARVLDLFAGSGALGLEALSRGAKSAIFVESNRTASTHLQETLKQLNAKQGKVVHTGAELFLKEAKPNSVDILFLDPPFTKNLHETLATQIDKSGILSANALIYMESPAQSEIVTPSTWIERKSKKTGDVRYRLLQLDCDNPLS